MKYLKVLEGFEAGEDWIGLATHGEKVNGVPFTEDIVSHRGASFVLFPYPGTSQSDIAKAKSELKDSRDVVSLKVADDHEWDDLYKSAYFRDPRTKPLKWYQIEQDEKLIRKERKKGTTPKEFVDQFVLPNVKDVEKMNRDKFGDKLQEGMLNEASKSIDVENERKLQAQYNDKIKEAKLKMSKMESSNKKQFEKTLEKSKLTQTIAKLTAMIAASMNKEAMAMQGLAKEQQNMSV